MAPNCHPHVAILIVTAERLVGAVKDCLQRHLSKTKLIRRPNIKHGRCKISVIYSHLTNKKVRDDFLLFAYNDMGGNPLVTDILRLVFQQKLDIYHSGKNGICIRICHFEQLFESATLFKQLLSCSSFDLMTTQDVIFSPFMVSLLWFWLTQPKPVKTLIFS